MDDDDGPDFGDLDGLARPVGQAIDATARTDLPDHGRQARLTGIEAARAAAKGLPSAARKYPGVMAAERDDLGPGTARTPGGRIPTRSREAWVAS